MDKNLSDNINAVKNPERRLNYRGAAIAIGSLCAVITFLFNIYNTNTKDQNKDCKEDVIFWRGKYFAAERLNDSILIHFSNKLDQDTAKLTGRLGWQENSKHKLRKAAKIKK